ncbi:MAG: Rpn family recombination-promoting nuclease/putative transposase [Gemmatimonadetes bacterium]|nr:Rpn family recombination-promoting nuclease/putative transposase [Gemmatimonadota bacterium]
MTSSSPANQSHPAIPAPPPHRELPRQPTGRRHRRTPEQPARHHGHSRRCSLSRRHDQSYKLLFSLPLAVEHMIRGFVDDRLADELDFTRAESLGIERSTPSLVRFQADMLWKIPFRGSSRHLLLQLEFQSAPERYMAVRALCYVALHYHGLTGTRERRAELAPGGRLPPVLAITIYNGRQRWTAPDNVFDLIEPARGWLAERQPRLPHQVLDLRTLARQPLIAGDRIAIESHVTPQTASTSTCRAPSIH